MSYYSNTKATISVYDLENAMHFGDIFAILRDAESNYPQAFVCKTVDGDFCIYSMYDEEIIAPYPGEWYFRTVDEAVSAFEECFDRKVVW